MTYLKAAIGTIAILICTLFAYAYFTYNSDYQLNIAANEFLKGDTLAAQNALEKLKRALPQAQFNLYQAYLARAENHIETSNRHLEEALSGNIPINLRIEIYLNQALNAYLDHDAQAFNASLFHLKETARPEDAVWIAFFTRLGELLQGRCVNTLEPFQQKDKQLLWLSTWMKKAFEEVFTPFWHQTQTARCLIGAGKFYEARQMLEVDAQKASLDELNDIDFLMGLSYLKEAEEKNASIATPYFKLAFSHFQRTPMLSKRYAFDRQRIVKQISLQPGWLSQPG